MHEVAHFHWIGIPLFLFFIGLIITKFVFWRRPYGLRYREGTESALQLLEKRYVNGEIDETEFKKMRENLKK